jgi:hypothetical protein
MTVIVGPVLATLVGVAATWAVMATPRAIRRAWRWMGRFLAVDARIRQEIAAREDGNDPMWW